MRLLRALLRFSPALLLLVVVVAAPLHAQATGRIVGRVIDAAAGAPVAGAVLEVVGTALRTQAAIDGRYSLSNVPAGPAAVRVRFIGYQPKVVSGIEVPGGSVVQQDISLAVQAVELEEITVAAAEERGSVNRALDEQRSATNMVSSISAEQIARSPDGDAGQAVQRVSGVSVQDGKYVYVRGLGERYTTASLNGSRLPSPEPEKKVVPLDLFPAGMLEGITTSKTFTPEQPGDFTGAAVDLKTREFSARRAFTFTTSTGINSSASGKAIPVAPTTGHEWLGFAGSERAIPRALKAAGDLGGQTTPQVNSLIASMRDVWSGRRGDGNVNGGFGMSLGGEDPVFGQRIGYLGSFSYGYNQEVRQDEYRALATTGGPINEYSGATGRTSVLWGGLLNLSTRIGPHTKLALDNLYTRTADNEAIALNGTYEEFSGLGDLAITRLTFTERTVRSHQLSGEHLLGERHFVDWKASVSSTRRYEPDRSDLVYQATRDPATGAFAPTAWADLRQSATRTYSDTREDGYDLGLNYRLSLGNLSNPVTVKVGGGYRHADRDSDSRAYDLRNLGLTDEERREAPEELFGAANALAGKLFLTANSNAGRYTADDHVAAGFAQLEIPLTGRLRLITGARIERWKLDLVSIAPNGDPTPVHRDNTDLLPAASLNYQLSENHQLRLSASQTLSRPEYRELSTVPSFDILGGLTVRGNDALQRSLVQNYDARWEWYPHPGEAVSIGVFAKHFSAPIERVLVAETGASSLKYVNADGASNYGIELEVRKGLALLAPALANFTVFANATLMHSRITPGNDSISALTNAHRPMYGQANYVVNAGLNWIDRSGGWSATALYNVVGRRIAQTGTLPLPDAYDEARHVIDASVQLPLFHQLTMRLDGKNLLNAPYRTTQGEVLRLRYTTGRIFGLGLTWRP
jgi:outer membrane receptor protein involved in Fe transport